MDDLTLTRTSLQVFEKPKSGLAAACSGGNQGERLYLLMAEEDAVEPNIKHMIVSKAKPDEVANLLFLSFKVRPVTHCTVYGC